MKTRRKSSTPFYTLLTLLGLASAFSFSSSCARFGRPFAPADKGGSYLILDVKSDAAQLGQNITQTMTVLEKRCELLGIRCKLERLSGDRADQVKIHISVAEDPERI